MWTPVTASEVEHIKGRFEDFEAPDNLEAEYIEPPFYTRAAILRLRCTELGNAYYIAVGDGELSEREFYPLDGNTYFVHEANKKAGITLETPAQAEAYMYFFCYMMERGDYRFNILDNIDGFTVVERAPPSVTPPVFKGAVTTENGSGFLFGAFMEYGGHLFNTDIAVLTDGYLEMLDDDPYGPLVPVTRH
ncbi:hypothetical protein [Methylobacterium sp. WSM2598]|uniref:hypothetical protein n=1 Tax=Methylobacterium sp. WSM2598 TaxID=398261 RepID=UPI0003741317|nr:hypothetical protein [Methylobacterium sp. WSM2598]